MDKFESAVCCKILMAFKEFNVISWRKHDGFQCRLGSKRNIYRGVSTVLMIKRRKHLSLFPGTSVIFEFLFFDNFLDCILYSPLIVISYI